MKPAYELRISAWSSDVCSSDLAPTTDACARDRAGRRRNRYACHHRRAGRQATVRPESARRLAFAAGPAVEWCRRRARRAGPARSEEHTSELQSLMRISYAVFCLKKKNNKEDRKVTRQWIQKQRTNTIAI